MRVNWLTLGLAAGSFVMATACRVFVPPPLDRWLSAGAVLLGGWQLYCALRPGWARERDVVLRLWGLEWTRDEACCHFFITGGTGMGKTARAVVPIIHGLRTTLPDTGVLAIDSKGALWQPLADMARALGQEDSLRLIRVRPTDYPAAEWRSPLRLNLLADQSVPWGTYAKMLIDTATAAGQRGGQTFFKEAARDAIAHAMQALALIDEPVTLDRVHDTICRSDDTTALFPRLEKLAGTARAGAAEAELKFFRDFIRQPPEQKGGTVFTVANFLRPYTPPDIADVVCSRNPNFSLAEIDAGRLVCLSVPQAYQVERKYLNLLFKQLFFLHAFRRFDLDPAELRRRNLISLVLDEGQKTTLVSEDGFADHGTVDELREAGVCLISATQTPLSLYAAFETTTKADVFMANLRTQIHFRAADEKGAKIISEKMGGREIRKYSGGVSGGRTSRNWQPADEPWFKPTQLLALREGRAVIRHPRQTGRPFLRALPFTKFTLPNRMPTDASHN
ncbi:MAG: type IV secretion system DNA-binding domain-containing protein [Opitutaceae bacterium]|jgi:type IV secretory pathway TraG/TraD family ATPase VirD4